MRNADSRRSVHSLALLGNAKRITWAGHARGAACSTCVCMCHAFARLLQRLDHPCHVIQLHWIGLVREIHFHTAANREQGRCRLWASERRQAACSGRQRQAAAVLGCRGLHGQPHARLLWRWTLEAVLGVTTALQALPERVGRHVGGLAQVTSGDAASGPGSLTRAPGVVHGSHVPAMPLLCLSGRSRRCAWAPAASSTSSTTFSGGRRLHGSAAMHAARLCRYIAWRRQQARRRSAPLAAGSSSSDRFRKYIFTDGRTHWHG